MADNLNPNNFEGMDDERLVYIARQGNDSALEFLMNKFRGLVKQRSRAYFLIGGDREDLIQEGMLGLFKAIRDFRADKEASFRVFAELCITRQLITAIKTASRRKHAPLNTYISLDGPAYGEENDITLFDIVPKENAAANPEEIVLTRERQSDVGSMLLKLLSTYERAVFHHYLQGESYQEIGRILGKTPKSIDNALQRIKKKVSHLLGD